MPELDPIKQPIVVTTEGVKKAEADIKQTADNIKAKAKDAGKKISESFGDAFDNLQSKLAAVGAALAAFKFGDAAIREGNKAEIAMLQMEAAAEKAGASIEELTEGASKIGEVTALSADGAVEALKNLIEAGYSVQDALDLTETAAKLTAVSGDVENIDAAVASFAKAVAKGKGAIDDLSPALQKAIADIGGLNKITDTAEGKQLLLAKAREAMTGKEEAHNRVMETGAVKMKQFSDATGDAQEAIGQGLMKALGPLIEKLGAVFKWISELDAGTIKFVTTMVGSGGLIVALAKTASAIRGIGIAVKSLMASNPITALLSLVAAIGVAVYEANANKEGTKKEPTIKALGQTQLRPGDVVQDYTNPLTGVTTKGFTVPEKQISSLSGGGGPAKFFTASLQNDANEYIKILRQVGEQQEKIKSDFTKSIYEGGGLENNPQFQQRIIQGADDYIGALKQALEKAADDQELSSALIAEIDTKAQEQFAAIEEELTAINVQAAKITELLGKAKENAAGFKKELEEKLFLTNLNKIADATERTADGLDGVRNTIDAAANSRGLEKLAGVFQGIGQTVQALPGGIAQAIGRTIGAVGAVLSTGKAIYDIINKTEEKERAIEEAKKRQKKLEELRIENLRSELALQRQLQDIEQDRANKQVEANAQAAEISALNRVKNAEKAQAQNSGALVSAINAIGGNINLPEWRGVTTQAGLAKFAADAAKKLEANTYGQQAIALIESIKFRSITRKRLFKEILPELKRLKGLAGNEFKQPIQAAIDQIEYIKNRELKEVEKELRARGDFNASNAGVQLGTLQSSNELVGALRTDEGKRRWERVLGGLDTATDAAQNNEVLRQNIIDAAKALIGSTQELNLSRISASMSGTQNQIIAGQVAGNISPEKTLELQMKSLGELSAAAGQGDLSRFLSESGYANLLTQIEKETDAYRKAILEIAKTQVDAVLAAQDAITGAQDAVASELEKFNGQRQESFIDISRAAIRSLGGILAPQLNIAAPQGLQSAGMVLSSIGQGTTADRTAAGIETLVRLNNRANDYLAVIAANTAKTQGYTDSQLIAALGRIQNSAYAG